MINGDCLTAPIPEKSNRVFLGLIPCSCFALERAASLIDRTKVGMVHVHHNYTDLSKASVGIKVTCRLNITENQTNIIWYLSWLIQNWYFDPKKSVDGNIKWPDCSRLLRRRKNTKWRPAKMWIDGFGESNDKKNEGWRGTCILFKSKILRSTCLSLCFRYWNKASVDFIELNCDKRLRF